VQGKLIKKIVPETIGEIRQCLLPDFSMTCNRLLFTHGMTENLFRVFMIFEGIRISTRFFVIDFSLIFLLVF
jgi:hypothetical protein